MANTKKRCKQCKSYFPADSMIKVPAGTFLLLTAKNIYTKLVFHMWTWQEAHN